MLWMPPGNVGHIQSHPTEEEPHQASDMEEENGGDHDGNDSDGCAMELPGESAAEVNPVISCSSETDSSDSDDEDQQMEAYQDFFPLDSTALENFQSMCWPRLGDWMPSRCRPSRSSKVLPVKLGNSHDESFDVP